MNSKEIIQIIEDSMEVDEGTLLPENELLDYEEWDSLAILSLSVAVKDKYGISIATHNFNEFVTVQDVIDFLMK